MKDEEVKDEEVKDEEVKDKEVKDKETEAKPEPKPQAKTIQITNPKDGQVYDLSPQEVIDLATHGIMSATEEPKKVDTSDETTEERVERLENQLKKRDETDRKDKQASQVMTEINKCASKFDLTKDGSVFAENIKLLTLVRVNQNPRLNISEVFANETKKVMDELEARSKKTDATSKVQDAIDGGSMRGGSMPAVDTSKKYTPDDLLHSGSQEAMRKFLESQD